MNKWPRRCWINAPSAHDAMREKHGTNVVAVPYTDTSSLVYYLNGDVTSSVIPNMFLSEGWLEKQAEALDDKGILRLAERHGVVYQDDYGNWCSTMREDADMSSEVLEFAHTLLSAPPAPAPQPAASESLEQVLNEARAAPAPSVSAPAQPASCRYFDDNGEVQTLPGHRWVAVNEAFDDLMRALLRAESRGYMPDAMADEWARFEWFDVAPAPSVEAQVDSKMRLMYFYGVDSVPALLDAMEGHIERLQEKVRAHKPPFSFAPRRAREG